jgi:phosphatidylglycerol:prolipoprotein diacylglycerol transferase
VHSELGFVHHIDPVLAFVGPVPLYWYGAAYAAGFTGLLVWFWLRRRRLGLSEREPYDLCIAITLCVLLGARVFDVVVYEWDYYRDHPAQLLSYWHGGMASHGVLIGCALALWLFCSWRRRRFVLMADEVVIPGAVFLALGRIGNFINGQIIGYPTEGWWGVKFPEFVEFRHPVALYESVKNLALVPILLLVSRRYPPGRGLVLAHFVFWYGFLRLFTDYFRDYESEFLGIGRGQYFNVFMACIGLGLMRLMSRRRALETLPAGHVVDLPPATSGLPLRLRQLLFLFLVLFCLTIPSSWTQSVFNEKRKGENQAQADDGAGIHALAGHLESPSSAAGRGIGLFLVSQRRESS